MSLLARGSCSIWVTAETSRLGFWMNRAASFMYSPKVEPRPPRSRRCGKTRSRTWVNMASPPKLRQWPQRRSCWSGPKFLLGWRPKPVPTRATIFSWRVSSMSSRRANMRKVICSMTVSGLAMPPVQNSFQRRSMAVFSWLVSMGVVSGYWSAWDSARLGWKCRMTATSSSMAAGSKTPSRPLLSTWVKGAS